MLRINVVYIVTVLCLLTLSAAVAGAPHRKPASPVKIWISPQNKPAPGEAVNFVVRASSAIASDRFKIQVNPPAGMTLKSGSLVWEGRLYSGESHELHFSAILPKNSPFAITAVASIQAPNGTQFAARTVYRGGAMFRALSKPTGKRSFRKGRRVVEFPVK